MKVLLFLLTVNLAIAQSKTKFAFDVCDSKFFFEVNKYFNKEVRDHFILKKDLSYSYYIDSYTKQNIELDFENSDTIECVPYQYVLKYDLVDHEMNVIQSFYIDFIYKNGLLEMENLGDLEAFFKPYTLVVEKKLIQINQAIQIAIKHGYKPVHYELDYEKKVASNNYKKFKPKIIWTLKELFNDETKKYSYYRVIEINAKNGKVLREYHTLYCSR
jgi:hypothetical protein